jgi:hypothetical protein
MKEVAVQTIAYLLKSHTTDDQIILVKRGNIQKEMKELKIHCTRYLLKTAMQYLYDTGCLLSIKEKSDKFEYARVTQQGIVFAEKARKIEKPIRTPLA